MLSGFALAEKDASFIAPRCSKALQAGFSLEVSKIDTVQACKGEQTSRLARKIVDQCFITGFMRPLSRPGQAVDTLLDQQLPPTIGKIELREVPIGGAEFVNLVIVGRNQNVPKIPPYQEDRDVRHREQQGLLALSVPMALAKNVFIGITIGCQHLPRLPKLTLMEDFGSNGAIGNGLLPKRFFNNIVLEVRAILMGTCEEENQERQSLLDEQEHTI